MAAIEELFLDQKRVAGRGRLAEAARSALMAAYESDGENAHGLLGTFPMHLLSSANWADDGP